MAATSTTSLPVLSSPAPPPSPPRKRLTKVFTAGRRRSSDVQSESNTSILRSSIESIGLTKSPSISSQRSHSRDDSSTRSGGGAGSASVKKLIPGHSKRERRRARDEELAKITHHEEEARGRQPVAVEKNLAPVSVSEEAMKSQTSLMTVDSEIESPPVLTSRDSHTGYLTTTSPLIRTTTVPDSEEISTASYNQAAYRQNGSTEQFPAIVELSTDANSGSPSPTSPALSKIPNVPPLPTLMDKADSLKPVPDPSKTRSKSPGRRFKDVFSKSKSPRVSPRASPRVSPERRDTVPVSAIRGPSPGFSQSRKASNPKARNPSPLRSQTFSEVSDSTPKTALPVLQSTDLEIPRTPPGNILTGPTTTVTPPTPQDSTNPRNTTIDTLFNSPKRSLDDNQSFSDANSPVLMQNAASGFTHRRVRSASGSMSHQRSKLSTSMMPPLTPTIEEIKTPGSANSRNPTPASGFFSSWMSAAQNAANSITNLTNQNRARTGTASSDASKNKLGEELAQDTVQQMTQAGASPESRKQLAVSTLGSGDLDLSHLGIEATANRSRSPSQSVAGANGGQEAPSSANFEDILARRAVSRAYAPSASNEEPTPIAEVPDPLGLVRPSSIMDATPGNLTPPNGSILEGETSGVRRTNSVRSKVHQRRSRGSSVTTAQSAIGAMIGASTATLANPGATPKLPGFAIASKQRNRTFHQQFRSVPEDDYLIEDYSCALQKEILLAGRIYISEGHICFSSNILGWVTTLIISFEEVVSIEKENTAIVIPNAIAVQTLHARHTFRSLLSREATYDLMIGIWRVSHPDSFHKSVNGKRLAAGDGSADNVAAPDHIPEDPASEEESEEESGSDDDEDSAPSIGSSGSMAGSEFMDPKPLSRKPSGGKDPVTPVAVGVPAATATGDATASVAPIVGTSGSQDFPGPPTHIPTECGDASTHYDKIIKDEIIQAPLGKVYTLLYGPQSSTFMRKFLVEGISKAQDLQLEDDKVGLNNEIKSRKYQYIKPLGGSIGPKQTNCITSEHMDFFDLEKAVSVTCTTQTPDVPSGSAFSVKTRYCLTWAPSNATRFQMNMTIEWTAKSWLKGPIEKGALDGQAQYGEDIVKTLRGALGRNRAATTGSKMVKGGKKKRKSSKKDKVDSVQTSTKQDDSWGALEILHPVLGPVVDPLASVVTVKMIVGILGFMVLWMWFRGSGAGAALSTAGRLDHSFHYDAIWQREESDLWDWLQDRTGVDSSIVRDSTLKHTPQPKEAKQRQKQRQALLKSKDAQSRLREEKKSMRDMEEAVRITQERLDLLQQSLQKQRNASR